MNYIQDALNRYRFELRKKLQADFNLLPEQTPSQKREKKEGAIVKKYKLKAFDNNGKPLYPKPRDAILSVQCDPVPGFESEHITHINCVRGKYEKCPEYKQPQLEKRLGPGNKLIHYYYYVTLPTCSICGSYPKGTEVYPLCACIKGKGKKGKFGDQRQLVLEKSTFDIFWKDVYTFWLNRYKDHY